MPRYRFAWSNFSDQLLRGLARALSLSGDPADALRGRYGARPKTGFVQEAWPTLLDTWLPGDSLSREFVVEELRAAGLGRTDISVRSKSGQLEYLGSCRNAPTLREIVLAAFVAAGETSQMEIPPVRTLPTVQEPPNGRAPAVGLDPGEVRSRPEGGEAAERQAEADLNDWVEATLKEVYNLSEVHRDQDGDIPIPRGSSVLFIRPHDGDSPFLEVFAPLLHGFHMSPDVYEAVNAINAQVPMAKATVSGDGTQIVLSAHLLTDTLSSREFILALDLVGGAADHFDTLLQKRFGGNTMLEDDDDAIDV